MSDKPVRRSTEPNEAGATRVPQSGDTNRAIDPAPGSGNPFQKLPMEFGRYRVEKVLGSGAMGAVYLAVDTQLDRPVALKIPRLARTGAAAMLKRMEREAKALALLDHPNICKVYDFTVINGVRFLALEYVQGETLKSLLQRLGRKRKTADAVQMIIQLARALGAAHDKNVVHRDLKPENIMRKPDGRLVIMDFGLNRQSRIGDEAAERTQNGTILGTPSYMSPEQAAGHLDRVDQRSDIYALGVMLYEMLTGEMPFSGTAFEIMGRKTIQAAPSPSSVNPRLPPELSAICDRMLARQPEDRFANCAEVVKALRACDLSARAADVTVSPEPTATIPADPGDLFNFLRESESNSPPISPAPPRPRERRPAWPAIRSGLRRLTGPVAGWWFGQAPSIRYSLLGAGAVFLALLAFVSTSRKPTTLQFEIGDPSLSVKFAGLTLTSDASDQPIVVTADSPAKFEVWQEGQAIGGGPREVVVPSGEQRRIRVSLFDGQLTVEDLEAAGPSTAPIPSEALASTEAPAPPPGAPKDAVSYGDRRFKLFREGISWHAAKQRCEEMGGRLAEVRSRFENKFLYELAKGGGLTGVWLGATDEKKEGTWVWSDDSGLAFNNFGNGEPDNWGRQEHYLMMDLTNASATWRDMSGLPNNAKFGFVCEWGPAGGFESPGTWVSLFDGKSLSGWKTHRSQPGNWEVRNGVLTATGGAGAELSHLYSERTDFTDFHLRVEARFTLGMNSGIWFRSSSEPLWSARDPQWPLGYEAQIEARPQISQTGSLIMVNGQEGSGRALSAVARSPVAPGEWFQMEIIAIGRNLQIRIDDRPVVDYLDERNLFARGGLALQQNGRQGGVEFRKIEIKDLKGARPSSSRQIPANVAQNLQLLRAHRPWFINGAAPCSNPAISQKLLAVATAAERNSPDEFAAAVQIAIQAIESLPTTDQVACENSKHDILVVLHAIKGGATDLGDLMIYNQQGRLVRGLLSGPGK
jgi:serine/threonine protein kinase